MKLMHALDADGNAIWAVAHADGTVGRLPIGTTLGSLLALPAAHFSQWLEAVPHEAEALGRLLPPLDADTEVWAAGVTYEDSRVARIDESMDPTVYERVYHADRPELFFKANGWRVAGPNDPISLRLDSAWNVPEPELAVVVNRFGEIVGFTICNDVSSRSIEGENPLYLPQAKVYLGSCAVGPAVIPVGMIDDPYDLSVGLEIERDGIAQWAGETSTARIVRYLPELVSYLFRADIFPFGVVLTTGTCLVPDGTFTLAEGDLVRITIEGLGSLVNPVVEGLHADLLRTYQSRRPGPVGILHHEMDGIGAVSTSQSYEV